MLYFFQKRHQIRFSLMLILASFLFASCTASSSIKIDNQISDPNSLLLKTIDCNKAAQAEHGWKWSSLNVIQQPLGSSLDDNSAIEGATCSLVGTYSPDWFTSYSALLIYNLTKYDKPVRLTPDAVKSDHVAAINSFSPQLISVGEQMRINCFDNSDEFSPYTCLINVQYTHILVSIRLSGDQRTSTKSIERFINALLARLDTSIQAIDHP